VSISQKELDDLKHKAEVSSQNYERLQKANERIQVLEEGLLPDDVPSEDGKVKQLEDDLADVKGRLAKAEIIETHPQLKDLWQEFQDFRTKDDNKGMNLKTAAKAFLVEKELLTPARKGLEKPTGGKPSPTSTGMSAEDVKILRESNFKKYREMLAKGQLKVE